MGLGLALSGVPRGGWVSLLSGGLRPPRRLLQLLSGVAGLGLQLSFAGQSSVGLGSALSGLPGLGLLVLLLAGPLGLGLLVLLLAGPQGLGLLVLVGAQGLGLLLLVLVGAQGFELLLLLVLAGAQVLGLLLLLLAGVQGLGLLAGAQGLGLPPPLSGTSRTGLLLSLALRGLSDEGPPLLIDVNSVPSL